MVNWVKESYLKPHKHNYVTYKNYYSSIIMQPSLTLTGVSLLGLSAFLLLHYNIIIKMCEFQGKLIQMPYQVYIATAILIKEMVPSLEH